MLFIYFLHAQIPDFQIVVSPPNIIPTLHTSMESSFIQLQSQFRKNYPYGWFCGPGSHINTNTYLFWYKQGNVVTMFLLL